jgi:DNA-binding transcriptional ArsR family regulator
MAAMSKQDKNDAVVKAVAHPIRREILRRLESNENGGLSPKALAKELKQPLGDVSYHIRTLTKAGVLQLVDTQPRRGAVEHFYKRAGNHLDRKAGELLRSIGKD